MKRVIARYVGAAAVIVALAPSAEAQEAGGRADVIVNGVLPAADDTYRVDRVDIGPLGSRRLLDTPYSISVVPVNLAENQQLQNVRELFRYIPSVQGENIRPQSRGLQAGVVQNTRIDGLGAVSLMRTRLYTMHLALGSRRISWRAPATRPAPRSDAACRSGGRQGGVRG